MPDTETPGAQPAPRRRFQWVRATSDRVPTRWFAGIATGLFLAVTAAFGGLATAATPEIPELDPGEAHVTDQRSLTIEHAVLIDELPDAGVYPEEGQRVLAVIATAENTWTEAQPAYGTTSFMQSFSVADLALEDASSARYDDSTTGPWLQPGIPVELVFAWPVDADAYADGDQIEITLNTLSLFTGSFVIEGQSWEDPVATAHMRIALEDLGAGE